MEDFKVDTKKNHSGFKQHLDAPDNHRIIFSASFGSGKTTFLKDFFEKNTEHYQAFHLYPVNYSVSSNEDIFELIKYDILFHFLSLGLDFEKIKVPKNVSFGFFVKNNIENIIMPFIRHVPHIGKALSDISSSLIKLYKRFEIEHEDSQIDQEKQIIHYLTELSQNKGSIKEEDFYTQLICELTSQLRLKNPEGKKTVLIIDDLDRIDPDHIFRILNVFSAHLDYQTADNKFDFDKIILVCDIHNIRKIYANRYGQNVDFSGYIDKFYSKEVFYFDIIKEVEEKLHDVFQTILIQSSNSTFDLNRLKSEYDIRLIIYLIYSLNKSKFLPIRKLIKFNGKIITIKDSRHSPNINSQYLSVFEFRFLIVYEALKVLYSDMVDLKSKLEMIEDDSQNNPYSDAKHHYLSLLLPFLTFPYHNWDFNENETKSGVYTQDDLRIEWDLKAGVKNRDLILIPEYKVFKGQILVGAKGINIFKLVKVAIDNIEKHKLNWLEN